eukprot:417543_1
MMMVESNIRASKRKPGFIYARCTKNGNDVRKISDQYESKAFSYNKTCVISTEKKSDLIKEITNTVKPNKRFVGTEFRRGLLETIYCSLCYQKYSLKRLSQCQYCGNLYFGDDYNNEYSFYRQLLYINEFISLSFELQCIMESKIMKYFLYDNNDMYRELAMWNFAKRYHFKVKEICDQYLKEASDLEKYKHFAQQLQNGKEIMCSAISSIDYSWKWPLNEEKNDENIEQKKEILQKETAEQKLIAESNPNDVCIDESTEVKENSREWLMVVVHYNDRTFNYKLASIMKEWVNDDYLELISAVRKEFCLNRKFNLIENVASDELIIDDIDDLKAAFQQDDCLTTLTVHLYVKINDEMDNKEDEEKIEIDIPTDESKQKLKTWFENTVKLPEYYQVFIDEGIDDLNDVKILEKQDLIDMGIKKVGHRKKILHQIKIMIEENENCNDASYVEGYLLEDTANN